MKIYVASSWRNEHQQRVVKLLEEKGHEVYDFKHPNGDNNGFSWGEVDIYWKDWNMKEYVSGLHSISALRGFIRDFEAMRWADICVLVLPCGRSAHAEAGWMAGNGKKTLAYIPEGVTIEPELMYHLFDGIVLNEGELICKLSNYVNIND